MEQTIHPKRRDFLKIGLAGAAAVGAAKPLMALAARVNRISLTEAMAMSPVEMAKRSELVVNSHKYLMATVESIQDRWVRDTVMGILTNPAPTFMKQYKTADKKAALHAKLAQAKLVDPGKYPVNGFLPPTADCSKSPQPFLSAPGSGYTSHHSYPGGVITHTALNLKVSLAIYEGYKDIYGYLLDRDAVIASQALHDLHKPWVFQWQADGSSRTEMALAGTGEHHPYSVAESIYRGLPPQIVVAQACAHNHPGWEKDETGPVNWIKAGACLAGVDPVKAGLLASSGKTLPLPRSMENFVCHLGDHDWILTVPAAKWLIPVLADIAQSEYGLTKEELKGKKFHTLRNYAFSQGTIMGLYHLYSVQGKAALTERIKAMVAPA